ncbi:hypothetical protein [Mongoliibacter sp.]|nr:hypothetical protein [Mongoliibacter sp.]
MVSERKTLQMAIGGYGAGKERLADFEVNVQHTIPRSVLQSRTV